jgi:hypothetical protein
MPAGEAMSGAILTDGRGVWEGCGVVMEKMVRIGKVLGIGTESCCAQYPSLVQMDLWVRESPSDLRVDQ